MKIAVISDIHENFHNLVLCFNKIEEQPVEHILCLGDLMNNGVAKMLAYCGTPVTAVWGNNDGDRVAITKTALGEGSQLSVGFTTYDIVKLGGRRLFLTHYPMLAKPMAKSGEFDAVFYGHNHKKSIEKINDCLVMNPGEISAHKIGIASFAFYDTDDNSAEIVLLDDQVSVKTDLAVEYRKKLGIRLGTSKSHQY
ncbi:MAG: metallophosphoesterase [Gammaproteobacteria bacterium]|nr:metallophosphoesterase [Gammaproteobacteria bacterium]